MGEADRSPEGADPFATNPEAPRAPEPAASDISNGAVIAGRYEVRELVGSGGMGAVYRVFDRELQEDVALKVLRAERLGDEASIARVRREARLARRIGHPNVCRVFDIGEVGGRKLITMEWVGGPSLRAVLRSGPVEPPRALQLFRQIVAGVSAAHELGIVHRDLKPDNVLLTPDGRAKVADFGLAIFATSEAITAAGAGTPQYMSPEQLRGEGVGMESDVFALGILGYELFDGVSPFGAGLPAVISSAILRDPPQPLRAAGVSPEIAEALAALFARALEKDPRSRFPDARAMASALDEIPVLSVRGPTPVISEAPSRDAAARRGSSSSPSGSMTAARSVTGGGERAPAPRRRRALTVALAASLPVLIGLGGYRLYSNLVAPPPPPGPPPAAPAPPSIEARVVVLDFEDLAREPAWTGLPGAAGEAVRSALRDLPGVRVVSGTGTEGTADWTVRGSVQRVGADVRVSVWFQAPGGLAGQTIEVDGAGSRPADLMDDLKSRVVDEARLLVRDRDRRVRAVQETESEQARSRLLEYFDARSRLRDLAVRRDAIDGILKLDPAYLSARLEHAELSAQMAGSVEDVDRALGEVSAILRDAPGEPRALTQQCRYRRYRMSFTPTPRDEDIDAVESSCRAALGADPGSSVVLLTLAKLEATRCATEKALAHLQEALARDRARAAEILPNLATFALEIGRLPVAEDYASRFVELQETEERLGPRALGRRAGMAPARGAFLLRGSVLLRLGRAAEASEEFERELRFPRSGFGAEQTEAAALYGLVRASELLGRPVAPALVRRLRELESKPRPPDELQGFAGEIAKSSPRDALTWLDRDRGARSCSVAILRASISATMGDRPAVSRALSACNPELRWQHACVASLRAR
ncbi:MAG: serine/threonine-protein kinase [Polyangiaceae bacterium]